VQIRPDDFVGFLISISEIADRAVVKRLCCFKGKGLGLGVAHLRFELRKIYRAGINPLRGACFKTQYIKPELF
jgi:hypothetical protein